ncbi:MAG TPA: hypothetical protein DGG95_15805 [Cytophagales bacterium]|jgi:putative ABC transport system permease protein|nr:hypothetical protein [Cytophagales bacterium]
MIKNYFFATMRNLRKQFTYSLINIGGIGVGFATCILLFLWINHETSFDRFHSNANRIYRGSLEYSFGGQTARTSVSPTALLPTILRNFGDVKTGVRIYNPSTRDPYLVKKDESNFQERKFYFADSTFFDVFSFKLLQGDPHQALTQPNSIILTKSMVKKYFNSEDVIGKTLTINNKSEYKITGVAEDCPSNSMIQFDFIASFVSLEAAKEQIWWSANYQTFILINYKADVLQLQDKVNAIVKKELASELTNPGDKVVYNFVPLTDIYLKSTVDEPEVVGSIQYVYIFSGIALLVLIIACINYVNLATAKAVERAKEVAVRKVSGAFRGQLIFQFLSESIAITFLGFSIALIITSLSLPFFNSLTGKTFLLSDMLTLKFALLLIGSWLVIALVAGIYPAITITSFEPAVILKGNFKNSGKGIWLRKSLVVFQFSVSIILMVGTGVIVKQLNFIQNKKLGYDKENIITFPLDNKSREVYDQLKTELIKSGAVVSIGRAKEAPTKILGGYSMKTDNSTGRGIIVKAMPIDQDFIPTLGMKIIAGQNFTDADFKRYQVDSILSIVVNESTLREVGLKTDNAINSKVEFQGNKAVIVGVVEDFHFSSLHEKIGPLVLFTSQEGWQLSNAFVRISSGNINEAMNSISKICSGILAHRPFEYQFLDQRYQSMYDKEQRMGKVTTLFAALAISIACLGLLGLVAYSASQKTKEIGIRKVLGATALGIMTLITKDYFKLVAMAILIGVPISYYLMEQLWLQTFAYHVSVGVYPFFLASLVCIVVSFFTASYQAVKAALINPTNTLRSE